MPASPHRRRWPRWPALLLIVAGLPAALPARAQQPIRFEVRAGAVYGGTLVDGSARLPESQGTDDVESVELSPGIGPAADAAVLLGLSPRVDAELRLGASWTPLQGTGPAGSWDAGSATAVTVTAGLEAYVADPLVVRAGLGKLFYSSSAPAFGGGATTGLLLSGGAGYALPVSTPFGLRIDADAQWHGFGSPALREAGAPDGSTFRVLIGLAATFGARQ